MGLLAMAGCVWCLAALPMGCQGAEPVDAAQSSRSLRAMSRLALTPRTQWQRLNRDGLWLVSPRFAREGSLLVLSGRGGKGLFVEGPDGALHVIDPTYRGPVTLNGADRVVCLPNRVSVPSPGALPAGLRIAGERDCPPVPFDPEIGQVLHDGAYGRWTHHPLRGELQVRPPGGRTVLVDDRAPWSIRVSPDGKRVAYSVGSLPEPTLYLWDETRGRRSLGTGVHPVFHPDGLLIYSKPDGALSLGKYTTVARAELIAHDLETGASWNLTDTPDLAEMQPALSPDGSRLAFVDWRWGGAYVATFDQRRHP
jgi:hypothetical protein